MVFATGQEFLPHERWSPSPAGSLAQARAGLPCLPVLEVLRDAWCRSRGYKVQAWRCIGVLVAVEIGFWGVSHQLVLRAPSVSTICMLLAGRVLVAPVFVWLSLQGAARISGQEMTKVSLLACYTPRSIVTTLLVSLLAGVGSCFCVIPGVYVILTCSMAVMITAQRKVAPIRAISLSYYGLSGNIAAFLRIQLLCWLFVGLSAIPLGVGLIWTLPWMICVQGEVFRRVFGVSTADSI